MSHKHQHQEACVTINLLLDIDLTIDLLLDIDLTIDLLLDIDLTIDLLLVSRQEIC